jgi:hypothetical protein
MEEAFAVLPNRNFHNQYEDGFQVLHPGKKMVGRGGSFDLCASLGHTRSAG